MTCVWCDNTGLVHLGTPLEGTCGWCDGSGEQKPSFEGWPDRECGEHRTVGPIRAWCFDCSEWCYASDQEEAGCRGCRVTVLIRVAGSPDTGGGS